MTVNAQELVSRKIALKTLDWLSPSSTLESYNSTEFGRDIVGKVTELTQLHKSCKISLNRRPAAVVIPLDEYDKLLSMKAMLTNILAENEKSVVSQATKEFDALLARVRAPESRAVSDEFFSADGIDLISTFKRGLTEQQ